MCRALRIQIFIVYLMARQNTAMHVALSAKYGSNKAFNTELKQES